MATPLPKKVELTGSILVTETTAMARDAEAPVADWPLAQYSAILDERTCPLCASLDGKIFDRHSAAYRRYTPPLHINSRSLWVYIGAKEAGKKEIYDPDADPGLTDLVDRHGHFVREPKKYEPLRVPPEPAGRNFIVRRVRDPHTGELVTRLDWQSWVQIALKAAKERELAAGRIALAGQRAGLSPHTALPVAGNTSGAQATLETAYRAVVPPDVQAAGDALLEAGESTGYNVFAAADDPRAEGQLRYAMYLAHPDHGAAMVEKIVQELGDAPPYTVRVRAGTFYWDPDWGEEFPVWFREIGGRGVASSVDYQLCFRPRSDAEAQRLAEALARFGTKGAREALPLSWAVPNARMSGAGLNGYEKVVLNVRRMGERWLATLTRQALPGWEHQDLWIVRGLAEYIR